MPDMEKLNINSRIESLALLDPVSARQIQDYILHDHDDPVPSTNPHKTSREVAKWFNRLAKNNIPEIVIVPGSGSNGTIKTMLELLPETSRIILMEQDLKKAAKLFIRCPLEDYIASGRLQLAFGSDADHITDIIGSRLNIDDIPDMQIFDQTENDPVSAEFYNTTLVDICNSLRLNVFSLGTLLHWGLLWQFNTIKNLPILLSNPGLNELKNVFKGKPAVIVGAGPSIDDAIPFLKQYEDKFVIMSACTALNPLRKAGIKPCLAVAIDASEKTAKQFETRCDDMFLASSSVAYPPGLHKFKGVFSGYVAANAVGRWLEEMGTCKGHVAAAGTVTACAIDMAIQMGCNPIITIGVDLSFSDDGTTHAKDTMYHGEKSKIETLVPVPGNYKPTVYTSKQMKCYVAILESYIKANPGIRFINVNTTGAKIDGMQLAHPSELKNLAPDNTFNAYKIISNIHRDYKHEPCNHISKEIDKLIIQLEELMDDTRRGAMICNQILTMLRRPRAGDTATAEELLQKLSDIDKLIENRKESSAILDMSLRPISFKMNAKQQKEDKHYSEAVHAIRRSRELYEQIVGAASWTRGILLEANTKIKEIDTQKESAAALNMRTLNMNNNMNKKIDTKSDQNKTSKGGL